MKTVIIDCLKERLRKYESDEYKTRSYVGWNSDNDYFKRKIKETKTQIREVSDLFNEIHDIVDGVDTAQLKSRWVRLIEISQQIVSEEIK